MDPGASMAAQAYHQMGNDGKRCMVSKYIASGPKNLAWSAEVLETSINAQNKVQTVTKVFFSRLEILNKEGVHTEGMDESTKDTVLQEPLKIFYARVGVNCDKDEGLVQDHTIPQLKKSYYEHKEKMQEAEVYEKTSKLAVNAKGMKIDHAQKMLADPSSSNVTKTENPLHVELMNKMNAVMQAKSKLEKDETNLKDIHADFEENVLGKPGTQSIIEKYKKVMASITDYLKMLRKAHVKVLKIDPSCEEVVQQALTEWTQYGETMLAHQEGMKLPSWA